MSRFKQFFCRLFHQNSRTVLLRGTDPLGLDDVVFCTRCDEARGRPLPTIPDLHLAPAMSVAR